MDPLAWALLLLAAGIVLVVLEFFLPSGGLLAVLAGLCILASLVVPFLAEEGAWWRGTVVLIAALICVPLTLRATIDLWPRSPFGRLLLIELPKGSEDVLPQEALALTKLVGRVGTAKGPMRPSGTVVIDGVYYPAVSEGMPIEPGAYVKAAAVRMRQLVVVPAREIDLLAVEIAASLPPRSAKAEDVPSTPREETRPLATDEVLRRNDDLAASIEALELFGGAAGEGASKRSDDRST